MESDAKIQRSFDLRPEQLRYIDTLVETGVFASTSEVVDAGLRALRQQSDAIERWLHEDVAPVYDRMQADPGRGIPAADVRARLYSRHGRGRAAETA